MSEHIGLTVWQLAPINRCLLITVYVLLMYSHVLGEILMRLYESTILILV